MSSSIGLDARRPAGRSGRRARRAARRRPSSHEVGPHRRAVGLAGRHRTGDVGEALVRARSAAAIVTMRPRSATRASDTSTASSVPTQSSAATTPPGRSVAHPLLEPVAVGDWHAAEASRPPTSGSLARRPTTRAPSEGGLLEHADPDGPGRPVHQDRVARADAGDVQHLGGGAAGEQQVGGLAEGQRRRLREHVTRRDGHLGGPAAADAEGEDLVADLHGSDATSVPEPTALTTPATS